MRTVCVCVCVVGLGGWSSFAVEKPGGGAASQWRSLGLEQLRSGEAWQKQAQPGLKVNIDSDKLS